MKSKLSSQFWDRLYWWDQSFRLLCHGLDPLVTKHHDLFLQLLKDQDKGQ